MLDIRRAYLDFGKQLQPPPDFEIDYAVATTYSLDLYALLSIPLAMYYKQNLDSEVTEDNFQILEAIQNLHKHLKIYCHKGKIALPKASSVSLLAFIEKSVVEVMPKSEGQSFHPKVWILRFKSTLDKRVCYRVIVMSRNLTFDKSYDVAYWMEGYTKTSLGETNTELINFLREMDDYSPIQHKTFIGDLAKVDFELCDDFKNYDTTFFPTKNWKEKMGIDKAYNRRMIISPFLSNKQLASFNEQTKERLIVFSRKNELDKLPKSLIEAIDPYCFKQEIVDHHLYENAEEGEQDEYDVKEWDNNLHAKIYIRENEIGVFWDLGSANCSNSAFYGNIEFMLHLQGNNQTTNIKQVFEELTKEYNGVTVFKKYVRTGDDHEAEQEIDFRKFEYALLSQINNPSFFEARVEKNEKLFDFVLKLKIPELLRDHIIKANPFGAGKSLVIMSDKDIRFENIPLHKLSSFMYWQIIGKDNQEFSFVTKVDVQNMPDYRLSNILKSIIDNPEKFMVLLMSLLTNEPLLTSSTKDEIVRITGRGNQGLPSILAMPIYEDLLITLSRNSKQLLRLATIIEKLSDLEEEKIIPEEFKKLWSSIKQLLPNE